MQRGYCCWKIDGYNWLDDRDSLFIIGRYLSIRNSTCGYCSLNWEIYKCFINFIKVFSRKNDIDQSIIISVERTDRVILTQGLSL